MHDLSRSKLSQIQGFEELLLHVIHLRQFDRHLGVLLGAVVEEGDLFDVIQRFQDFADAHCDALVVQVAL